MIETLAIADTKRPDKAGKTIKIRRVRAVWLSAMTRAVSGRRWTSMRSKQAQGRRI